MTKDCDLLIVGGGPAGLCAAINASSEGLKTCLLDAGLSLGGQAKESNAIENYPLPRGQTTVTGVDLMAGFVEQARRFSTDMFCPAAAAKLTPDGKRHVITTDDYQEYAAKSVLLSIGLTYRRHAAQGLGPLMGRGVYYGLPSAFVRARTVGIIGGANSAGQAALRLARDPKTKVHMLVRSKLADGMSQYLIDRIRAAKNIEVCEQCDVVEAIGEDGYLTAVKVKRPMYDGPYKMQMDALFIFIGAQPRTMWLEGTVDLDERKFIKTGGDFDTVRKLVLPYETNVQGVFAAGDVRAGSIKRISAAIGEGSAALQTVHRYLSEATS